MAILISETCEVIATQPSCSSPLVELLKAAASISTAATAILMIWQLNLTARRNATKTALSDRHVHFRARNAPAPDAAAPQPQQSPCAGALLGLRRTALRRLSSALFVAANCVHTAPALSGSFEVQTLGTVAAYRLEPVITVRRGAGDGGTDGGSGGSRGEQREGLREGGTEEVGRGRGKRGGGGRDKKER